MKMNKRQCIGLWRAKGWKLEAVEGAVQRRGYSRTSLSDMGQSTEPADPELVALAWKAKVLGKPEDFEIYWRGLASLGVEVPPELLAKLKNPPPRVEPQEISPKLETLLSSVVEKLETALSAVTRKLDSIAASLRGKLDISALAVEGRLEEASTKIDLTHGKLDSAHGKLDSAQERLEAVQATLNGTGAKIGVIDAKLDGNRREIRRVAAFGALAMLAAVSSCVASVSQRLTAPAAAVTSVPAPSSTSPAVLDTPVIAGHSTDSNAQHLGEKVAEEHWVPKEPLPNQKRAPCDPALFQVTVNSGCWVEPVGAKPPCGRLYRSGNKCYYPVAVNPSTPVGEDPQPSIK